MSSSLPPQDLQKLARETSSVVDGKLQEQLTTAQAQLFEEKQRRVDAEGAAQVGGLSLHGSSCKDVPIELSSCPLHVLSTGTTHHPACLPAACRPPQIERSRAERAQKEVDRLQRSLDAREALIQQLKTARMTDTPAREVGALQCCAAGVGA